MAAQIWVPAAIRVRAWRSSLQPLNKSARNCKAFQMTGNSAPVQLTDRAAKRIVEIMRDESGGASMLRVAVTGGGCSGFQYDFSVEQNRADDDLVVEKAGAIVLIDPVSLDFLRGAEIDFADEMIGAAFKINNPNATSSCGCGTSFSV